MPTGWRGQYARYQKFFFDIVSLYKKRQDLKVFLELFLTLGTISVLAVFALKPTLITIADLVKSNGAKEETITTLTKKIQALSAAHQLIDRETAKVNLIDLAVPDSPTPETFVRQVEGAAYASSVDLLSISLGEITLVGTKKKEAQADNTAALPDSAIGLNFSVNVSGPYPSLLAFLSQLQSLRRPIKVDLMNLNLTTNDTGKNLVLVVSGRTPYFNTGGAGGSSDKKK